MVGSDIFISVSSRATLTTRYQTPIFRHTVPGVKTAERGAHGLVKVPPDR
jgi:hypothetical protein